VLVGVGVAFGQVGCGRACSRVTAAVNRCRCGACPDRRNQTRRLRRVAAFSIIELSSQELAGEALLWGIDAHNRCTHIGVAVLPAFRRRGFGADTTRVLCHYGFLTLGLHRLQVETVADNIPMIQAATRAGFSAEGLRRGSCWANGNFLDEMILGQLRQEWQQR